MHDTKRYKIIYSINQLINLKTEMSSIQLTVANNTLNISINIAELLNKGSINISLNNQLNPEIPVAELVTDNTNVTIRKKTRKIKVGCDCCRIRFFSDKKT